MSKVFAKGLNEKKYQDLLVLDSTHSAHPCAVCYAQTRWFNLALQDYQCGMCFTDYCNERATMEKAIDENIRKKDAEAEAARTKVEQIKKDKTGKFKKIRVLHADKIYKMKRHQATWYLSTMWTKYFKKWDAYSRQPNVDWQGLMQCRHYMLAMTRLLKDRGAWDEFKAMPSVYSGD